MKVSVRVRRLGAGRGAVLSARVSVCVHPDLVVSAPFAAFGSAEPGTVYVYRGSALGVVQEPAQVIRGDQLNLMASQLASMRSFGAALSGDTDIDGNTYNGEHKRWMWVCPGGWMWACHGGWMWVCCGGWMWVCRGGWMWACRGG